MDVTAPGMMHRHSDTEVLDLWIGKDFVELVDRPRGDALLFQLFQPLRRAFGFENLCQERRQLWPIAKAQFERCILRRLAEIRPLQHGAERAPLAIAADADIDEAIGCSKTPMGVE